MGVSVELNWGKIVEKADSTVPEIQPILKNRPFFSAFAWCVYRCFNFVCRVLFRLEVDGLENLTSTASRRRCPRQHFSSARIIKVISIRLLFPQTIRSSFSEICFTLARANFGKAGL